MTMKGPFRDFFPIGAQTIKLRLPELKSAAAARLLVADKTVQAVRSGNALRVEVPSVLDHEVVVIEF
jgi:hypothetical protein